MASGFQFKLNGLDEIKRKIQQLTNEKSLTKATKKSSRQAMKPVLNGARANARKIDDPKTREKIYQNLTIRTGRTKNKGIVLTRVGILGGAKAPATNVGEVRGQGSGNKGGDTYYWRFVEFGTQHIPATPFMRPALEDNAENVLNEFQKAMSTEIDKELDK